MKEPLLDWVKDAKSKVQGNESGYDSIVGSLASEHEEEL